VEGAGGGRVDFVWLNTSVFSFLGPKSGGNVTVRTLLNPAV
jgi:hypothetical protein